MSIARQAPELIGTGQEQAVLVGVSVAARLRDLLSEVTIEQTYRNSGKRNIEAVYTFPLPANAELLALEVELGERRLRGKAVKKSEAQERYEDAITDGDAAVMLEQTQPGIFTMNVGNLLPGETCRIRFRYAELLAWQGDTLRFLLPTVIAPRYGDAWRAGVQPHAAPETDPTGDLRHEYALRVEVEGLLAGADITSPSHEVVVTRAGDRTVVVPKAERVVMDRDFVLNLKSSDANRSAATYGPDRDGYVVLASFNPNLPVVETAPRRIKIVVDCSGSMGGDSIAQAREALLLILDRLRPQDEFDIIMFGSTYRSLFGRCLPATPENVEQARSACARLDANMGGTEIGQALLAAFRTSGTADIKGGDVLLITDGEVWQSAEAIAAARGSGHRVFTVGVGNSVAEAVVRGLAEQTGGACELVAPNEQMAEKIVRHFCRIYAVRTCRATVVWPGKPNSVVPERLSAVYDGDTVHVFARFSEKPAGEVVFKAWLEDGTELGQRVPLQSEADAANPSTIARLAAATEIRGITAGRSADECTLKEQQRAVELAEAYDLVTDFTNYLVVETRAEDKKAGDLPDLYKVKQMRPAGMAMFAARPMEYMAFNYVCRLDEPMFCLRQMDMPTFVRCERNTDQHGWRVRLAARLDALHPDQRGLSLQVSTIAELEMLGLPRRLADELRRLVRQGVSEEQVVVSFLYELSDMAVFGRSTRRAIRQAHKAHPAPEALVRLVRSILAADNGSA